MARWTYTHCFFFFCRYFRLPVDKNSRAALAKDKHLLQISAMLKLSAVNAPPGNLHESK